MLGMKDTQHRLLESACMVFAEKGFHDAHVSEICERAGANIAAVNYYFGSKKKLYVAVLRHTAEISERSLRQIAGPGVTLSPEERLTRFYESRFAGMFSDGPESCFGHLIQHETTNPTFAHEDVFRDLMEPTRQFVDETLQELLGAEATEQQVHQTVVHLISLFAFFQASPMARNKFLEHERSSPEAVQRLARRTTRFALAGIRALAEDFAKERR